MPKCNLFILSRQVHHLGTALWKEVEKVEPCLPMIIPPKFELQAPEENKLGVRGPLWADEIWGLPLQSSLQGPSQSDPVLLMKP